MRFSLTLRLNAVNIEWSFSDIAVRKQTCLESFLNIASLYLILDFHAGPTFMIAYSPGSLFF